MRDRGESKRQTELRVDHCRRLIIHEIARHCGRGVDRDLLDLIGRQRMLRDERCERF